MTGWKERQTQTKLKRARILISSRAGIGGGTGAGTRQVPEGARGMPWLPEAKKGAAGCEKPRGGANGL